MFCEISTTTAALVGAIIGGVIGLIGNFITNWFMLKKEKQAFIRAKSQKHYDDVAESYRYTLNCLSTFKRTGAIDDDRKGDIYGRISLLGSSEVQTLINDILDFDLSHGMTTSFDLAPIIAAMKSHQAMLEQK